MKHINAMLNDKQANNLQLLFTTAWIDSKSKDVLQCDLLPEEIDELKQILLKQPTQNRLQGACKKARVRLYPQKTHPDKQTVIKPFALFTITQGRNDYLHHGSPVQWT